MEAFAVASGAAGLVSLGIEVCKGLLNYYQSWRTAETEVAGMYNSIESLAKTLILLESAINNGVFDRQMVDNAEKSIMSTQDGITSLKKKLDKIKVLGKEGTLTEKAKAPFRRAIYPLKQSVLVKLKEVATDLRDDLALALNVLQMWVRVFLIFTVEVSLVYPLLGAISHCLPASGNSIVIERTFNVSRGIINFHRLI